MATAAAAAAAQLKGQGNDAFRRGQYQGASAFYQQALGAIAPWVAAPVGDPAHEVVGELFIALNSNSAECYLRLDDWEAAAASATAALARDTAHAKSKARLARAEAGLQLWNSLPLSVDGPPKATPDELRRAVAALLLMQDREAPHHERVLCTRFDGLQDDRCFDVMALLQPSCYQAMADIVQEELEEFPARLRKMSRGGMMSGLEQGCLTSALCSTNLRNREVIPLQICLFTPAIQWQSRGK
jgi:tetratricopeptide (TPR) repeat protein